MSATTSAAAERLIAPVTARARRRVWSIRWIATGMTVLLTTLAVLSVGMVSEHNARLALDRELQSRTLVLARNLALTSSGALLGDFPELTLQPVVRQMLDQQPELALATVVDHEGRVQAHPDASRLGAAYEPGVDLAPFASSNVTLGADEALRRGHNELLAEVPVREPGGTRIIGRAIVGLRRGYIDQTLAASRRQQSLVMVSFVIAGMVVAFILMSGLLRPIAALRAGLLRIGRGDLDSPIALKDRTELGLLADTVNEMTRALRQAQSETVERERLGREMELAREIQQSLLPALPVSIAPLLIRGDQRPAAEVGGDYYDYLNRSDGRIAIAVADVAGKGLAGCLVMAMLSALLRALRDRYDSPAEMLAALDERLGESLRPGVFVTMFYGILDPATGRLVYASAGHNPLLVHRRGGSKVEVLTSKGLPLAATHGGVIRRTLCDEEVVLEAGDLALQYTDGYTEAFASDSGREFGLDNMTRVLSEAAGDGAEAVLKRLRGTLEDWTGGSPPTDDQTLLVISSELTAAADGASAGPVSAGTPLPRTLPGDGTNAVEPLEILHTAEARGVGLELAPSLDALAAIRPWLRSIPAVSDLGDEEINLLASALYEASANIAEHGFQGHVPRPFHLWWCQAATDFPAPAGALERSAGSMLRDGCFVIRDDGAPYRPESWKASDFRDRSVRLRGRGIGLDIIHNVMRSVGYYPGTSRGNITVLTFGPRGVAGPQQEAA